MTGTGRLLRRIDLGQLEGCRRPGRSRPTFLPRRPNPPSSVYRVYRVENTGENGVSSVYLGSYG